MLEGKLVGPWVDECRSILAVNEASRPALDLSEVHYVDAAGTTLLAELDSAGRIRARSPFLSTLLARETSMNPQPLSRPVSASAAPPPPPELALDRLAGLYGFAERLLEDEDLAQELTRRTFLAAPEAELGALKERLVVAARARLTHPGAWSAIEPLLPVFVGRGAHLAAVPDLPSAPVPAAQLRAAQRALPALHRAVLLLCDCEGLNLARCAAWLALEEPAVRSARHQARQALVTLLARAG